MDHQETGISIFWIITIMHYKKKHLNLLTQMLFLKILPENSIPELQA